VVEWGRCFGSPGSPARLALEGTRRGGRREALDEIEAAAQDEDIVEKAQNNAEASIREFLKFSGYKKVEID
jgi:hypothetical protein